MIAIIETGGKQYIVSPNQKLSVERLEIEKGNSVVFDKVLLVANDSEIKVGKPYIAGAKVSAQVLRQTKGDKIRVVRYKAKSRYRRTTGHRQKYTEVNIEDIRV